MEKKIVGVFNDHTPQAGENSSWQERLRQELNAEQFFFVTHHHHTILGIAGPGSGKTRALTYRLANLLQEKVPPHNIMLVTFTNKAAEEMKKRVREIAGYLPPGLWAGTFHSIGARMLRRHAPLVERSANFSILDEDDRAAMLKLVLASYKSELKEKDRDLFVKRGLLGKIISSARNSGLELGAYVNSRMPELAPYLSMFYRVEEDYEEKKRLANAFDYDDLLIVWLRLLQENADLLLRYQEQFQHILVDEFQDTNVIQDRLILLLGEKGSTCLVGDDAQSIYSFRCAEIDNMLNFPHKKAGCTVVKLVQNYRSVPEILELANCSISNNNVQIPKQLTAVRPSGDKPRIYLPSDNYEEAGFVTRMVQELYSDGLQLQDIAVLYRSSYLSQDIELALINQNIPYLTFGGLKFLQRAHIKDILAWLKILENPRDELSWQRVALLHEGIGPATFQAAWQKLKSYPNPLEAVLGEKILPQRGRQGWQTLKDTLARLHEADRDSVPQLISIIMKSPYGHILQQKYPDDYVERSLGIERLAAYGARCASVRDFLESLLLEETLILDSIKEENPDKDFLTLSTIHSAKGKEWKAVFVVGLNEGHFPSALGMKNLEEERRLFYVAVTRAKDFLYLTAAQEDYRGWNRYISGPSPFLTELPLHCYQVVEEYDI
ncbi:MAG: ATP-dependent helicase [Bacillota bacterium]